MGVVDKRKRSEVKPVKQSERVLNVVRQHRRWLLMIAALLVIGFGAWLTVAIVQQARGQRVAQALLSLQERTEEWESKRAELQKEAEERDAESLLAEDKSAEEPGVEADEDAAEGEGVSEGGVGAEQPSANEGSADVSDQIRELDREFSAYLEQQIEESRDDVVRVEALWSQVELKEREEDFPGAQQSLARLYQQYPRQPSARIAQMRSAQLYYQQQQDDRAMEQWDLLRAGSDGLALTATLHLGMVKSQRGEYQQARALLEDFLNKASEVPESEGWQNLANSYLIALDVREQQGGESADAAVATEVKDAE